MIDMHESEESKMARFVSGLRRDIQDVVELYEYSSLEKIVHLTIKVESQLSKKTSFQKSHNDSFYHLMSIYLFTLISLNNRLLDYNNK